MAVYRANTSNIYGKDYSSTPGFDAVAYRNANAGKKFVEQVFNSSGTWARPNGVEFVELLLVAGGGGGAGSTSSRRGGGGGGAGVFYGWVNAGSNSTWIVSIGSGGGGNGVSDCTAELWGRSGNTTAFGPSNSYSNGSGVVNTYNHGYIAVGGGGGGHPCGGSGQYVATGGGSGSNQSSTTRTRVYGEASFYMGLGYTGGATGDVNSVGGGGGSVIGNGATGTGAAGTTILGRAIAGGGAGGGGTSGGSGAGGSSSSGTINTGGGGGGGNANQSGGSGGSGLCVIRYYV